MPGLGTILGVWAHPDDETYLSAGIMAEAVCRGERVACITATRGEAGSWDEERWPSSEIARVRAAELIGSLAILGVTEHHWLDYPDGGCADVAPGEAVAKVAAIMTRVRPDTVLTFGPEGQTGHPDHIAVSAWTTEAFERAAPPAARLYYATVTPEWAERYVEPLNRFNVFSPGSPSVTPRDELGIDMVLDGDLMGTKVRAIRAQVSQIEVLHSAFDEDFIMGAMSMEMFRLAKEA
jgi:LmbE family N-acetylglucosaminyl deacetylase